MTNWTAERKDRLRELAADGWSGSQIGAEFGLTRNAVIGQAHRLGLSLRGSGGKSKSQKKRQPKPQRKELAPRLPEQPAPIIEIEQPPPRDGNVTVLDLNSSTCRWPINEGRPQYYFCGEQPAPGSPYCEAHHELSYAKSNPPQRWSYSR